MARLYGRGFHGNFLVNKLTLTSSNASGATVNPLQSGSTFEVSAVFDLTMPQKNDEAYCLELGDWQANSKNDPALWAREVIRLCVHKNSDNGSVRVRFNQKDASTGVSTLIDKVAVETGHQQIRFRLARNDAAKNAVTASYAYLDGGVAGKEASLTGSASVFTYKPYTIPALLAFTPVSSADTSGTTNKLTLNAHIEVSSDYQGKTGNIYILVLTPGMGIFVHNGSNWAFWSGGTIPAYASGVALKSQDIPLLKEMDASLFVGTKVYVGYGLSDSDMLDNGLYNLVNTIQ